MNKETYSLTELEELILEILSQGRELYGLEIIKIIEDGSRGKYHVGFGSLYPALRRLESRQFVRSSWDDSNSDDRGGARRRYYRIEALGKEALVEKKSIRKGIEDFSLAMTSS